MKNKGIPPEHYAMIERIAKGVSKRIPDGVGLCDDLLQEGLLVYPEALKRWDPQGGCPLDGFLGRRCRGAMIDYLRKLDPLSQRSRRLGRNLHAVREELVKEFGREPTLDELADRAGLLVGKLTHALQGVGFVSVDIYHDSLPDRRNNEAEAAAKELDALVQNTRLNERQKEVLKLIREGVSQKDIAPMLKVTEARISQLVSGIVSSLRRAHIRQEFTHNQGGTNMGANRNTMPASAAYWHGLKMVVRVYFTAEWITTGLVQGVPNIREEIERFDASKFIQEGLKKGDLVEVPNGSNGKKYRLNHASRNVIKAAMEVGRIAGKGKAQEKAGEIYDDHVLFGAFCQELHGLNPGWFEIGSFVDNIRKDLKLEESFWPLASLELLMKALAGYAPKTILSQSVPAAGGYQYRINLPDDLKSEVAELPAEGNSDGVDVDDKAIVLDGSTGALSEEADSSTGINLAVLPSPKGQWRTDLVQMPAVRLFFLGFIGTAGPRGWKRSQEIKTALKEHKGWDDAGVGDLIRLVLRGLEVAALVRKRGENRGREYQLTDNGRQTLSHLISRASSAPTTPTPPPTYAEPDESSLPQPEPVHEPEPSKEAPLPPSVPSRIELPSRSEVEAALLEVNTDLSVKGARRQQISIEISALKAQITLLERESSELLAAESCYEPERIRLQALLTEVIAAEEAEKKRVEEAADAVLAGLDPRVLEAVRVKLLAQG